MRIQPKVSVIIPCYNVEEYIDECLTSVINQDYTNIEIICIDDCSTDNTFSKLLEYQKKDNRIILIKNDHNKGLSETRNVGINSSSGEYMWFIDSDDYIISNSISELVKIATSMKLECILFKMKKQIECNRNVSNELEQFNIEEGKVYSGKDIFCEFYEQQLYYIEACRYFWNSNFIKSNHLTFYSGLINEDSYFSFFALMKVDRITFFNREMYVYRIRNGSIMDRIDERYVQSLFIMIMDIIEYWRNHSYEHKLNIAIDDYIDRLLRNFIKRKSYFSKYTKIKYGSEADAFLYNRLCEMKIFSPLKYCYLEEKDIDLLKKYHDITIYGAGTVAKEIIQILQENGIKYNNIVVSDNTKGPRYIDGYEILNIKDIIEKKNETIIIVAMLSKHWKNVKYNLDSMGFKNIMFIREK